MAILALQSTIGPLSIKIGQGRDSATKEVYLTGSNGSQKSVSWNG